MSVSGLCMRSRGCVQRLHTFRQNAKTVIFLIISNLSLNRSKLKTSASTQPVTQLAFRDAALPPSSEPYRKEEPPCTIHMHSTHNEAPGLKQSVHLPWAGRHQAGRQAGKAKVARFSHICLEDAQTMSGVLKSSLGPREGQVSGVCGPNRSRLFC